MKEYICENCDKKFDRKSNWLVHTQNKKKPCVKIDNNDYITADIIPKINLGGNLGVNLGGNLGVNLVNNKAGCQYCLKIFSRPDSLKRHIEEERCEVLKLQQLQKENIFKNLLYEENVIKQAKHDLKNMTINQVLDKEIQMEKNNQTEFLMTQIKLLNDKLEKQKKESELKLKQEI